MSSPRSLLRYSAVIAAVLAILAALGAATASAGQTAVVARSNQGTVSLINAATNRTVGEPIGVGAEPTSVAITPDGKFAYVTDSGGESVSVVELAGVRHTVATIGELGVEPTSVAITPDGRYAYVTDGGSDEVSVIETATKAVRPIELPPGSEPSGIAITPDGKLAYVVDAETNLVEVFSTATLEPVGKAIEVGAGPRAVEFTPDGSTAFVVDEAADEVSAIKTATREVTPISSVGSKPTAVAVSPDGKTAYVVARASDSVAAISTATDTVGDSFETAAEPQGVTLSADGKTLFVTERGTPQVEALEAATGHRFAGSPTALSGAMPAGIALTPDQSPVAAFTPPSATVGIPATFNGSASTDADGTIASYAWTFEDGRNATGAVAVHTYAAAGLFNTKLTVTDNEGCGEAMVFTGQTAYCSGGESASVIHPVTVKAAPVTEPPAPVCKSNFGVGGLSHNRKNGTARLRVNLHTAGSIFLFGKKVHAVSRKAKAAGSMLLTLHARVMWNKRLKRIHHTRVPVRITFTPSDGCGYKTVHRSLSLLRAKKKRHRH